MSRADLVARIARGLKKPPTYIVRRALSELRAQGERYLAPRRAKAISVASLARAAGYSTIDDLWTALGERRYLASVTVEPSDLDRLCPRDQARIVAAAQRAERHEVDLLGSGLVSLGPTIDWHQDYKTGLRWPPQYARDIDYNNPERPSDVKFPWELSRMQWMIPLGQAYLLTRDERYAVATRELLVQWFESNPYAGSVNWSCTMDVALRMVTWTWLFHAFKHTVAWKAPQFRERFLKALYLHGVFIARNLEHSDINGNHYTADAAGLVIGGLFFGELGEAARWSRHGWKILCEEIQLQVFPDGVDFEASVPYHRLVQELFLLPAIFRGRCGLEVPQAYVARLVAMARFTAAYSRPDGSVPLWGDADDARVLPFGGQAINDHRYLVGIAGIELDVAELVVGSSGSRSEAAWLLGTRAAAALPERDRLELDVQSTRFPDGGFYIMRSRCDHVFIDCGPVGLGGRGGHGHNDLLSFEAVLDGEHLVSDCGAYLYTASYEERNRFRSTAYHNTPQIDGEELNRLVGLWQLHDDARHMVTTWRADRNTTTLVAGHTGYERLADPVRVTREVTLDARVHSLAIVDRLEASGSHAASIPLHLAPGVHIGARGEGSLALQSGSKRFLCVWSSPAEWELNIAPARVSPSYGRVENTMRLGWTRRWRGIAELRIALQPA